MNAYVVDRKALEQNIQVLREKAGNTPIYGVIKGNGYGLGLIPMAQVLRESGIDRFAVTGLEEVCALRDSGFSEEEILMMVDQGEETGVIGESAKDMISNIFDASF